jgi:hypothetical protein
MKKLIALILALACSIGLAACGTNKHTCRPLEYTDEIFDHKTTCEPFVTDEERDELLNKAIRKYLDDFGNKSDSFTYEIISTHWGVYEGNDALMCWVKIVYGEGFTTVKGFIVQ